MSCFISPSHSRTYRELLLLLLLLLLLYYGIAYSQTYALDIHTHTQLESEREEERKTERDALITILTQTQAQASTVSYYLAVSVSMNFRILSLRKKEEKLFSFSLLLLLHTVSVHVYEHVFVCVRDKQQSKRSPCVYKIVQIQSGNVLCAVEHALYTLDIAAFTSKAPRYTHTLTHAVYNHLVSLYRNTECAFCFDRQNYVMPSTVWTFCRTLLTFVLHV